MRLLADENLNSDIVRGLIRRRPDFDIITAQQVVPRGLDDPGVLAWAAHHDRIVVTHDQATMPDFAYQRVDRGEQMPGVFVVNEGLSVRRTIEELLVLAECSSHAEWNGRVVYLPL